MTLIPRLGAGEAHDQGRAVGEGEGTSERVLILILILMLKLILVGVPFDFPNAVHVSFHVGDIVATTGLRGRIRRADGRLLQSLFVPLACHLVSPQKKPFDIVLMVSMVSQAMFFNADRLFSLDTLRTAPV